MPSYLSCLFSGMAGSTEGSSENSESGIICVTARCGCSSHYSRFLSSGKLGTGISMPDNCLVYENRFTYLRWKFPAAGCSSGTAACSSRSSLSEHSYLVFKEHCSMARLQYWHGVSKRAHKVLVSVALGAPSSCWHWGTAILSSLQCVLQVRKRQSLRLVNLKDKNRLGCSVVEGSFDLTV